MKRKTIWGLAIIASLFAFGCAPSSSPPEKSKSIVFEPSYTPLLWDGVRPEGQSWSVFTLDMIQDELANDFMPGTEDVTKFCPAYHNLKSDERANFWGLLISAIAKFESDFNPASRMKEPTMGKDSVTGLPVYSEGLLQVSYQDEKWAPCDFDWNHDRHLGSTDIRRTILTPTNNLSCGVQIFARQLRQKHRIALDNHDGGYWAVLIDGNSSSKIKEISAITRRMPGCLN